MIPSYLKMKLWSIILYIGIYALESKNGEYCQNTNRN